MDKMLFHANSYGDYVTYFIMLLWGFNDLIFVKGQYCGCHVVNYQTMLIITIYIECVLTKYLLCAKPCAKHQDIIAKKIYIVSQFSGM